MSSLEYRLETEESGRLLLILFSSAEPPAAKAARQRRRGGKHRHKALTAEAAAEAPADAGKEGANGAQSAADPALVDGALSDNLACLQLDRLASNAAAGTLGPACFQCTP